MKSGKQRLIATGALALLVSVAGCKQPDAPPGPSTALRSSGGSSDETAMVQALVALLYLAGKQTRDSGACGSIDRAKAARTHSRRLAKRLFCDKPA